MGLRSLSDYFCFYLKSIFENASPILLSYGSTDISKVIVVKRVFAQKTQSHNHSQQTLVKKPINAKKLKKVFGQTSLKIEKVLLF